RALGAHVDDFRYCPTHPEGAVEAYRRADSWRKPGAGMLLDLIAHWPVDLVRSVMIGDKDIDMEAGQTAGLLSVKIRPNGLISEVDALIERALAK
ncbi:MAG: HAD hydrolase-like protein, partial [Pseudomonadota bacterium]|nr:HAD hydrolase-like protein [Pseudomonadota bacterium]